MFVRPLLGEGAVDGGEEGVGGGVAFVAPEFAAVLIYNKGGDGGYAGGICIVGTFVNVELIDGHTTIEALAHFIDHRHHVPAMRTPGCIKFNHHDSGLSFCSFVIHKCLRD